ncbi:probable O-methyltransferase 3 [Cucurbita pepo subsp. pepo]|uniref:probable O-methyltransferase 3 n=1 Tax=Cucurbita pepo subsp. pepo TaxID=3664 RepID=UPI000C9D97DC|nr:probable O-methyltransferase 3 [Cucurbita pepo subsp. pepo]
MEGKLDELLQSQAHVWNHVLKFFNSMSLKCAVELGIPDVIHSHAQPMSLSDLVAALHIQPSKAQHLGRLMRLLVHSGFFDANEQEDVKYSLTPSSRLLLRHNTTFQITPFLFLSLDKTTIASLGALSGWLCSSDADHNPSVFEMANGKPVWEYAAQEPSLANLFQQTMACDSEMTGKIVIEKCSGVFEGLKSLVDVGGGTGVMANAIAEAFPHITCSVFDLPQVVSNIQPNVKNLSFIAGDMLESKIPPANAVMLKWVLHNWDDEQSIKILKKCKDAIPSRAEGGKLIILDMVLDNEVEDRESTETQLFFDVLMMVNLNGKERNEKEWKNLFMEAGFSDYTIVSKLGLRSLIEVYP